VDIILLKNEDVMKCQMVVLDIIEEYVLTVWNTLFLKEMSVIFKDVHKFKDLNVSHVKMAIKL
jgi:hypothetical protein